MKIEAAKHNFLLRGYFNKRKKAEDKKIGRFRRSGRK
jgi:phospholipid/cholesterol/gamma-HCH transport system substrate-binding protein